MYMYCGEKWLLSLHVVCDSKSPKPQKPKGKEKRVWDMGGTSTKNLDYSGSNDKSSLNNQGQDEEFVAETVGIKSGDK